MTRAKFSWVAHWREQYALGEVTIEQFEVLIESAIRAEALPKRPRTDRSPEAVAERWSAAAARVAANYTAGVSAHDFGGPLV